MITDGITVSSEKTIAARAVSGDRGAFGELVKMYQNRIYNYCCMLLQDEENARDITQESFTRAMEALNTFNIGSNFGAWIFRIARNLSFDWLKSKASHEMQLDEEMIESAENTGHIAQIDVISRKELKAKIEYALKQLKPIYRDIIIMKHYEELSYEEISDITQLPVNAIRIRVMRARREMQNILKNMEEISDG